MKVIQIKTKDLKPYPGNERIHPAGQIDELARNIKRFGFDVAIVVDEDNVILKGHGRLLAAKQLGLKAVPCTRRKGLSKAEKAAIRISDNRIADFGMWDEPLLVKSWGALPADMQNLTGWSDNQIKQISGKIEFEAAEEQKEESGGGGWDGESGRNPNLFSTEVAFASKESLAAFRIIVNECVKKFGTPFQGDALLKAIESDEE